MPSGPRRTLAFLALGLAACAPTEHLWYLRPPAPPSAACESAKKERPRIPKLLAEGKLNRAIRLMQSVEGACPEDAPQTWGEHVLALAQIGRSAEARTLADAIDRSTRADELARQKANQARALSDQHDRPQFTDADKSEARALFRRGLEARNKGELAQAKTFFLDAWTKAHPYPRALIEAGLLSARLGDATEAQRLYDRAAFDGIARLRPVLPDGVPTGLFDTRAAWATRKPRLALASGGQILVLDPTRGPIWRTETGINITAIALSSDADILIAAFEDGAVRRWDLVADAPLSPWSDTGSPITAMALSPDGATLAMASADRKIQLWGMATGARFQETTIPAKAIRRLAWSHDGHALAWASQDKLGVWQISTDRALGPLTQSRGEVLAIGFAKDDRALDVVDTEAHLLWNLDKPRARPKTLDKTHREHASISTAGVLVTHTGDSIVTRDLESEEPGATFAVGEGERLLDFIPSPDGTWLGAAYLGRTLRLLPLHGQKGQERERVIAPPQPIESLAISPDGRVYAAGTGEGKTLLFRTDVPGLRVIPPVSSHTRALAFSPDGATLAVGSDKGEVRIFEAVSGEPQALLTLGPKVLSLAFSPDGSKLAAGGDEPLIRIWDARSHRERVELHPATGSVRALAFSKDGSGLLSASQEGLVLWDPAAHRGARFVAYGPSPLDVAFVHEGSGFAVATSDATLSFGEPSQASPSRVIPVPPRVLSFALARSGSIATAEGDGAIRLRAISGKIVAELREPEALARKVAFAPNGSVVGGFADGSLRLFRLPETHGVVRLFGAPGAKSAGFAQSAGDHLEVLGEDAEAAREALRCRLDGNLYPFEVCAELFHVPGLFKMVLAGEDPAEARP